MKRKCLCNRVVLLRTVLWWLMTEECFYVFVFFFPLTQNQLQYDNTGAYCPLVAACAQSTVYVAQAAPLLCFLQINHCIFLRPECPNGFFFFFFKHEWNKKKTINIKNNNNKRTFLQSVIEKPSVRLMRCKKKKKNLFGVSDEWPSLWCLQMAHLSTCTDILMI